MRVTKKPPLKNKRLIAENRKKKKQIQNQVEHY